MAKFQSGSNPANEADVDEVSKAVRTSLYATDGTAVMGKSGDQPATIAGVMNLGLNDREMLPLRVDRFGSLASAMHRPILVETFEGTTIHATRWLVSSATMTATQSSATGLTLNSGSTLTAATGYMIQSSQRVLMSQRVLTQLKLRLRMVHFNNSAMEFGFGDAASAAGGNNNAAIWQRTTAGAMIPTIIFNGTTLATGNDIASSLNSSNHYTYDIYKDDDSVVFTCQDVGTGLLVSKQQLNVPLTASKMFANVALPVLARVYNSGTPPPTASQMFLSDVYCAQLDAQQNMDWGQVLACMGRSSSENPFSGAATGNVVNSAAPSSATLSNTAAGYTTLGGKFQFAAVAGAATDYALFVYTVPAGSNFMCTGVIIDTWNTGAASATTPTLLDWSLAHNSNVLSLATGGVNRIFLGAQSIPVGAAVGAKAERIDVDFPGSGYFTGSGRLMHIVLRIPVSTATASQVIQGSVTPKGYFL